MIIKNEYILVIGASTGGPKALQNLLPSFPADFPICILIAQHMPPNFTYVLANLIDSISKIIVREATDNMKLKPGWAFISPGGNNITINKIEDAALVNISKEPDNVLFKPCIDLLFVSAAKIFREKTIGIILTGLSSGKDGLVGCKTIKEAGGIVIAEAEESSLMYGMPKNIITAGYADHVIPLWDIPKKIMSILY